MTTDGDVLRRITKEHEPIPVTGEELEEAIERLDWFTSQGGDHRSVEVPPVEARHQVVLRR